MVTTVSKKIRGRIVKILMKKCSKCDAPKTIDQFYKVKGNSDGYDNYCKVHRVEATSAYHARNKDKQRGWSAKNREKNKAFHEEHGKPPKTHPKKRICPKCRQPRLREEFRVNRTRSSGRDSWCVYCYAPIMRLRARRWYRADINRQYVNQIRDPLRRQKVKANPHLHNISIEQGRIREARYKLRQKGL